MTSTNNREPPSGAPLPSDPNEYRYVEVARGGVSHRGTFAEYTEVLSTAAGTDVYTSVYLHSEELEKHAREHPRKKGRPDPEGKPSVADYTGPVRARGIHWDLDHPDAGTSLIDALRLCRRLVDDYGVDPRALRIYFTGSKGFHVELVMALLGGAEPSANIPQRVKRFAEDIATSLDISTFDSATYDRTRLWRVPNTVNSKSNLYKTPLTYEELCGLTIEEIKGLAVAPRAVNYIPDDEWLPNRELAALWAETDLPEEQHTPRTPPAPSEPADATLRRLAEAMLAEVWPEAGKRHLAALALQGGLALAGWPDEAIAEMAANVAARAMGDEADTRADEWHRGAATTIAKVTAGQPVVGWPTLAGIIGDVPVSAVRQLLGVIREPATVIFPSPQDTPIEDDSPCAHWKTEAERWKARALQAEALVAEMQAEQSISAQIKRNKALKAAAPANLAAINWVDSEARRGQVDPSGFVRAPMKYIGELAGSSSKRASEHIADVGEKLGIFKRTHRWETCNSSTGEVYEQPIKVTYLKPLMPKIEAMRRLATYTPDEEDGNGWGGKREKRLTCSEHPDSALIEITGCATCGAVLKERTIAGPPTGQDDPSENDPAGDGHSSGGRDTFLGQDDRSGEAAAERPRSGWYSRMKDPIGDFRDCAHCGKHQRYEVCLDCAKKLGDWGVHAAEVAS